MAFAALSTVQTISTGQVFLAATLQQANDNDNFLVNPPACSIKETTAQSTTSGTPAALTSDEENFDNDAMHSTVTNTSRITINTAGRYLCLGVVSWAANSTGIRSAYFRTNGTTDYSGPQHASAGASNATTIITSRIIVCAAADYIELMANQTSGGALNTTMTEFAVYFLTQ